MRILALLVLTISLLGVAIGQTYTPKAGETAMVIGIEGRGDVYVLLHTKEAPRTTAHILKLVRAGFYNGLRFHRVLRSPKPYLVQVGSPASRDSLDEEANKDAKSGGSGAKVPFEDNGLANVTGAVGLAHELGDKDSGDSQFYMLLSPAKFLDGAYTVFGQVVAGMDVLEKIELGDRITSIRVIG